jgi:multidrug efflux system membrane fusion protein
LSGVIARRRYHAQLAVDVFDRSAQKKIASGELLALDNQIDTTTGTVKVRSQFDNKDNALFPNQFVTARLLVDTLKGVTLVPASTVQQNGQSSYVYVIQNGVAHVRNVKPGVTDAGMTQLDSVKPGEVIADSSFDKLQDNARVTVVSKPTPAAPPVSNGNGNGSSSGGRNSAP